MLVGPRKVIAGGSFQNNGRVRLNSVGCRFCPLKADLFLDREAAVKIKGIPASEKFSQHDTTHPVVQGLGHQFMVPEFHRIIIKSCRIAHGHALLCLFPVFCAYIDGQPALFDRVFPLGGVLQMDRLIADYTRHPVLADPDPLPHQDAGLYAAHRLELYKAVIVDSRYQQPDFVHMGGQHDLFAQPGTFTEDDEVSDIVHMPGISPVFYPFHDEIPHGFFIA